MAASGLSEREMQILATSFSCFETEPKVDYDKLCAALGLANKKSATASYCAAKAKMKKLHGGGVESNTSSPTQNDNTKSEIKGKADGKGGGAGKKRPAASGDDDDNEDATTPPEKKKRGRKPKNASAQIKKGSKPEQKDDNGSGDSGIVENSDGDADKPTPIKKEDTADGVSEELIDGAQE